MGLILGRPLWQELTAFTKIGIKVLSPATPEEVIPAQTMWAWKPVLLPQNWAFDEVT